ncbi:MAG: glutamyl-tRNA reductase [Anaerolineales bacterium]|nr:glutamyl-tRNA reductase [Anaerolineales bacterium]
MRTHRLYIQCLGLNHQTASIALREKLAFTPHRLEASLARLGCGNQVGFKSLQELVILSTCNRVELYAVTTHSSFDLLEAFLAEIQNIPIPEFSSHIYRLQNDEAVGHLLAVAAGLDSVVLGEPQILGQVTEAYSVAGRHGTAGKILSRLFQSAIHAGKRARTETSIAHNPASISSVAVNRISETVSQLSQAQVMVLGAGEMAELAVEALRKRGAGRIVVVNRTVQRAQELARRWDGQAAALEMLLELLPQMDIVITSTGAPHTIIQASMVEKAMQLRPDRPMVFMDIAVPRDVDPEVGAIPAVSLYDMDTLAAQLEHSLSQREAEIPQVKEILVEELSSFQEYLATLDVIPLIVELRQQANDIRQAELEKVIRRMPDLPSDAQEHIEILTKSIVNKILHSPTARLRKEANGPNAIDYADIARGLFGLD